MTSPLCVATGGWCRRVFHYRPPTPMYRNSPPLCTIVLQIPSLMPLKMRKVQFKGTGIRGTLGQTFPRRQRNGVLSIIRALGVDGGCGGDGSACTPRLDGLLELELNIRSRWVSACEME